MVAGGTAVVSLSAPFSANPSAWEQHNQAQLPPFSAAPSAIPSAIPSATPSADPFSSASAKPSASAEMDFRPAPPMRSSSEGSGAVPADRSASAGVGLCADAECARGGGLHRGDTGGACRGAGGGACGGVESRSAEITSAADTSAADTGDAQLIFYVGLAHRGVVLADYGKQRKLLRSLVASALLEIPRHVSRFSMGYGRTNVLFAVDQSGLATFAVADGALDRPRAYSILDSIRCAYIELCSLSVSRSPSSPRATLRSASTLPPSARRPFSPISARPPPSPPLPASPPPDTPPRPATADPASLRAFARRLAGGVGQVSSSSRVSSGACHVSGSGHCHRLSHSSRGGSGRRETQSGGRGGTVDASSGGRVDSGCNGNTGSDGNSNSCNSNGTIRERGDSGTVIGKHEEGTTGNSLLLKQSSEGGSANYNEDASTPSSAGKTAPTINGRGGAPVFLRSRSARHAHVIVHEALEPRLEVIVWSVRGRLKPKERLECYPDAPRAYLGGLGERGGGG
ncbi:unnamed protein product [Closterium sp. Yama58-4]|nr:unnamed protein product [Closterium sp. Yama58-4]